MIMGGLHGVEGVENKRKAESAMYNLFLLCKCTKPGCVAYVMGRYTSTGAHTHSHRDAHLSVGYLFEMEPWDPAHCLREGQGGFHMWSTLNKKSFSKIHTQIDAFRKGS